VTEVLTNPGRDPGWTPPPRDDPGTLHRTLPGYAPTPLRDAPEVAAELGVARAWLKDEAERFGLPSFKALGAWWAGCCALAERLGEPDLRTHVDALRARAAGSVTLVCATDGNHGRALARLARMLTLPAHVYVPSDMTPARRDAIAHEGAHVEVVDGTYDDAVARSAARVDDPGVLVVSDTSWPGYTEIPRRVIEGYATLFAEIEEQGGAEPDVALIPIGVGALAAAAAAGLPPTTRLIGVEPVHAACALESARAGRLVTVPGPHTTVMAGLACGIPSPVAWPAVSARFDAFCAIEDDLADEGVRRLAALGLDRGECSGGVVGAAQELELDGDASVLLLLTEGVTDHDRWRTVVG
jgi:diaminopropionate ammonia-lyase